MNEKAAFIDKLLRNLRLCAKNMRDYGKMNEKAAFNYGVKGTPNYGKM